MILEKTKIKRDIPIPLYYQLKNIILDHINSGKIKQNDMIPTELEFSLAYNISRTTVRQAIIELVYDGYLYRIKGKGTFVSKPKIEQDFIKQLESYNTEMEKKGLTPRTKLLDISVIETTAEDILNSLNLKQDSKVIKIVRLRYANDEPIVIVETYLPYDLCSFLFEHDLEKDSLYYILSLEPNTKIVRAVRTVEAILAGENESDFLNIAIGAPVQFFSFIAFNNTDVPIEYSKSSYRGDRNKFTVEVKL